MFLLGRNGDKFFKTSRKNVVLNQWLLWQQALYMLEKEEKYNPGSLKGKITNHFINFSQKSINLHVCLCNLIKEFSKNYKSLAEPGW